MGKLRLDSGALARIRQVVDHLPLKKYDAKLPKQMQRDPKEYERRMNRRAAVCVALCNVEEEAAMLLTLRSEDVGTHAGQVSFPGGHIEENETPEMACLRELFEETELQATPIGCWHDVRAVTGTMVTPVICFIDKDLTKEMVANAGRASDEVALTFSVSIEDFVRPETRTVEELRSKWKMPRFQVPGVEHPPIWGLTAFMIDGVLRDVLCPALDLGEYPPLETAGRSSSSSM